MNKVPETVNKETVLNMLRKLHDSIKNDDIEYGPVQVDITTVNGQIVACNYNFTIITGELPDGMDFE